MCIRDSIEGSIDPVPLERGEKKLFQTGGGKADTEPFLLEQSQKLFHTWLERNTVRVSLPGHLCPTFHNGFGRIPDCLLYTSTPGEYRAKFGQA